MSNQLRFHKFFSGCSEPSCPAQPSHPLRRPGGFVIQCGSMYQNLFIFSKGHIWKYAKRTISTMSLGVAKGVLRFGCIGRSNLVWPTLRSNPSGCPTQVRNPGVQPSCLPTLLSRLTGELLNLLALAAITLCWTYKTVLSLTFWSALPPSAPAA